MRNRATLAVLAVTATVLAAGCTPTPSVTAAPTPASTTAAPTTPSATPTQTPTPSPTATLSADQEAALEAGLTYWKALDKIARAGEFHQYAIIKALRPTATDPVIQSNLNGARKLWESNTKVVGDREVVNPGADMPTTVGKNVTSVQVHFCVNQDTRRVNKKTGKQVGKAYPAHLQTDYEMRTVKGVFKVYEATTKGAVSC